MSEKTAEKMIRDAIKVGLEVELPGPARKELELLSSIALEAICQARREALEAAVELVDKKSEQHLYRKRRTRMENETEVQEEQLPPEVEPPKEALMQIYSDPFAGAASASFNEKAVDILRAKINPDYIEIRPDGLIYVPQIKYRKILMDAFGPGGWALIPLSPNQVDGEVMSREYGLYAEGRYVSSARGECRYRPDNQKQSYATAAESAKSDAITRCCKDLGIAAELWDKRFALEWQQQYGIEVWCKHKKTGESRKIWRRKNSPPFNAYPWIESGSVPVDDRTPEKRVPVKLQPASAEASSFNAQAERDELDLGEAWPWVTEDDDKRRQFLLLADAMDQEYEAFTVECSGFKGRDGKRVERSHIDKLSDRWLHTTWIRAREKYNGWKQNQEVLKGSDLPF